MGAPESGKDGKILIGATPIADITSWEYTKDGGVKKYASSSTAGRTKRLGGIKDATGTIEYKWDSSAASPLVEGSAVTLLLYLNGTEFYTVPAVIETSKVRVDIETGEITSGTATFGENGAPTEPTLS